MHCLHATCPLYVFYLFRRGRGQHPRLTLRDRDLVLWSECVRSLISVVIRFITHLNPHPYPSECLWEALVEGDIQPRLDGNHVADGQHCTPICRCAVV